MCSPEILLVSTALYDDLTVPTTTNLYINCISPKVTELIDFLSTAKVPGFLLPNLHHFSDERGDALQRVW